MDSPGLPVSTLVPTTFQQNIGIELRYAMQRLRIDCWINRNRKPRLFFASDLHQAKPARFSTVQIQRSQTDSNIGPGLHIPIIGRVYRCFGRDLLYSFTRYFSKPSNFNIPGPISLRRLKKPLSSLTYSLPHRPFSHVFNNSIQLLRCKTQVSRRYVEYGIVITADDSPRSVLFRIYLSEYPIRAIKHHRQDEQRYQRLVLIRNRHTRHRRHRTNDISLNVLLIIGINFDDELLK